MAAPAVAEHADTAAASSSAPADAVPPSLFWDTMPSGAEQHPDFVAMQALKEESTPIELAENFKIQGNMKLKAGVKAKNNMLLREAVALYGEGLALHCGDAGLDAVLHSNRAHVESLLGNWRKALQDSLAAVALDSSSIKAHYRGARAALNLRYFDTCLTMCEGGVAAAAAAGPDEAPQELLSIRQAALEQQAAQRQEQQARTSRAESERAQLARLVDALEERGVKMMLPQEPPSTSGGSSRPWLDEGGTLHWPLVLVFPETMQRDTIQDVGEHDVLADHLDEVFGPDAPPLEWDTAGEYTRQRVELYYLANVGKALPKADLLKHWKDGLPDDDAAPVASAHGAGQTWVRVAETSTLAELTRKADLVVPAAPMLFIVASGTDYRRRMLGGAVRPSSSGR